MADIFGTDILVPEVLEEGGSMGAAVIGGVGCGLFEDFSAVNRFITIKDRQKPDPELHSMYCGKRKVFDRLYEALKPLYPDIIVNE